jgi:hypothetical protein
MYSGLIQILSIECVVFSFSIFLLITQNLFFNSLIGWFRNHYVHNKK